MMDASLDQPLGQNRPSAVEPARHNRGQTRLLHAAIAVSIGIASTLVALRGEPFRQPSLTLDEIQERSKISLGETELADKAVPAEPTSQPMGDRLNPSIVQVGADTRPTGRSVVVIRDPMANGQELRVAHLPVRNMIEESPHGPLPIRADDGRRPFDAYRKPWKANGGARIAIVIGGLGLSQSGTQQAIGELPANVTLGFASAGNSLSRWMKVARNAGHEIVMQVPLEPFDFPRTSPGRNTLTVEASRKENLDRLYWTLARTTNYFGIMNYMGARFLVDQAATEDLMGVLGERGLLFFDDGSAPRSLAGKIAQQKGAPFVAADIVLDIRQSRGDILKQLDQLEALAKSNGYAIATGSAFEVTVNTVVGWVREASKRGIELVPLSALATDPEHG